MVAVVTYHPGPYLATHVAALRAQGLQVVIIDNGSPGIAEIRRIATELECRLVANPANLGIAAALNQAARLALAEKFSWLATFDQDSLVEEGAISGLIELHASHPERDRIAVLAMSHRDRNTGQSYNQRLDILEEAATWRSLRSTITSGSLVRADVFSEVGLFDETLFIDCVDDDFCLRCRRGGWLVICSRTQILEHSIGNAKIHTFLGKTILSSYHSPTRRYYISRNNLEVSCRYLLTDTGWSLRNISRLIAGSLVTLMFEGDRLSKFLAMLHGFSHFLMRRFGSREPARVVSG